MITSSEKELVDVLNRATDALDTANTNMILLHKKYETVMALIIDTVNRVSIDSNEKVVGDFLDRVDTLIVVLEEGEEE
tara:strand:- start:11178 stop:11411 length:234 start_codon:yes stop_codon:yes gene_type:complete